MATTPTVTPAVKHPEDRRELPEHLGVPDTLSLSVPAKADYKSPVLSQAEEQRWIQEELLKRDEERRRREGEQALEYVKQGETRPSESDIRAGMSHPSVANRPGYAPDPGAPYAPDPSDLQPTARTRSEQEGGAAALRDSGQKQREPAVREAAKEKG